MVADLPLSKFFDVWHMPSDWKINACQRLLSSLESFSRGCSGVAGPLVCVKFFQKISEAEALKFGNFTPQNKKTGVPILGK